MSKCGACGNKARHVALVLPLDENADPSILHECTFAGCLQSTWHEQVQHLPVVLSRALANRHGFDHEGRSVVHV